MPESSEILMFEKYLFLFAHPDDDLYCCALIKRLVESGKEVLLIYATSGDGGKGGSNEREQEVLKAARELHVKKGVVFLRISERELLKSLNKVVKLSLDLVKDFKPDCIIGQDYEGGHEGHDAVSFCASEIARMAKIKDHFVFPIYYGKPKERKGARFKPERKSYLTLGLSIEEQELKKGILEIYASQESHFEGLQQSSGDYKELLLAREVYFKIDDKIDYSKKPMAEVGYEYHRNGFKFADFKNAINSYKENLGDKII